MKLIFSSEGDCGSAQSVPEEEYYLPSIVLWLIAPASRLILKQLCGLQKRFVAANLRISAPRRRAQCGQP